MVRIFGKIYLCYIIFHKINAIYGKDLLIFFLT